jgi:glycosyl transferase family 1
MPIEGHQAPTQFIGWKPKFSDQRVASVRLRCLNPLRELQSRGYPVELFDPAAARDYSAVVYSKLYDARSHREATALREAGVRIVLDMCDNHFYNPSGLPLLQRAGEDLRRMMEVAHEFVASTHAMAEVLQEESPLPRPITVIGDAIEDEIIDRGSCVSATWHRWRLDQLRARLDRVAGASHLVWFGVHGGPSGEHGLGDLAKRRDTLMTVAEEFPLTLTVISNSRRAFRRLFADWRLPVFYLDWHPATFHNALRAHQVAVIPIGVNPFTRCKSNNRVVTALACGLGVVADRIPSYEEFANVCRLDDWVGGLRSYLGDAGLRSADVRAGQRLVAARWTLRSIADEWQALFDRMRGSASAPPLRGPGARSRASADRSVRSSSEGR